MIGKYRRPFVVAMLGLFAILIVNLLFFHQESHTVSRQTPKPEPFEIRANTGSVRNEDSASIEPENFYSTGECRPTKWFSSDPRLLEYRSVESAALQFGSGGSGHNILSDAELDRLIEQDDTLAMTFRANRIVKRTRARRGSLTESDLESLELASKLYYRAALQGRVYALHGFGTVQELVHGGPVELGWIERKAYEELSPMQKSALSPDYIYMSLIFDVAPNLGRSYVGLSIRAQLPPEFDKQEEVRRRLLGQFAARRAQLSVPAFSVLYPAPSYSLEEVIGEYCDDIVQGYSHIL